MLIVLPNLFCLKTLTDDISVVFYLVFCCFEGGECITCLVAYLHGDLHNDNDIRCLEQMVSTVISLERSPVPSKQLCSITHQKRSGKILHKVCKLMLYLET